MAVGGGGRGVGWRETEGSLAHKVATFSGKMEGSTNPPKRSKHPKNRRARDELEKGRGGAENGKTGNKRGEKVKVCVCVCVCVCDVIRRPLAPLLP